MSTRIPIGWTACVEGEPVPCGIPLERLDEDGKRDYGVYVTGSYWTGAWLAYRVVEAERPPLEYPAEPVLTEDEVERVVKMVSLEMAGSPAWDNWAVTRVTQMVERALLQLTREVGR